MKSRAFWIPLLVALAIVAGIGLFFFLTTNVSPPLRVARADRDCAPWDGPAFTLSIPVEDGPGATLVISIWQSPDIKLPAAFSFPDESGRVGNAVYRPASGEDEALSGRVSFRQVQVGTPVEGQFNLTTESGRLFSGGFKAGWAATQIACG